MKFLRVMLADADGLSVSEAFGAWSSLSEEARTRLVMFAVYGLLILLIAAWAIFIRKQKSRRQRIRRPHGWQQTPEDRKHRHGRHRRHRSKKSAAPINPTLAQSGGLPPVRPDDLPPNGL